MEIDNNDRKTKESPVVLEEPESKRARTTTTTTTKRTINVFYQDIKLPIAFYPGTKTRELVTLILKGMRLPLAPDGRNENLVTFSDEEGHMTALSSYVDDGASLLMQYRAPSYSMSSDSTITTTTDDDETSDLDSFFSSSSSTTTTTTSEDDDDEIDSTDTEDDDTVIYQTTDEEEEPERAPEVTRIRCKGGEAVLQHLCFVRWAMKHSDISAVADAVYHIVLALCNLYEFDTAMQWDFQQSTRYNSVDESCQVASTQGYYWPYVCTTLGGITEQNSVFRWRVSFSGIASDCAGYLHLGVVYDDERGLIGSNPAMSLMPSIQGYSHRRVYDVIIDTRPQSCAMHLVDVPGLYLYCTPLNRLPAADRPLRLAVWTKLSNQITIEAFHRYTGSRGSTLLPSSQPLCVSEFAYRHTTVQCQHEDLVR